MIMVFIVKTLLMVTQVADGESDLGKERLRLILVQVVHPQASSCGQRFLMQIVRFCIPAQVEVKENAESSKSRLGMTENILR